MRSKISRTAARPAEQSRESSIRPLQRSAAAALVAMPWLSFFCRSLLSRLLVAIAHLPCDLLHLLAKRLHLFSDSRVDDRQALLKTLKCARVN